MKHHIGTVEKVLGTNFGKVPMEFQTTKNNNGPNIHNKTNTRNILRA